MRNHRGRGGQSARRAGFVRPGLPFLLLLCLLTIFWIAGGASRADAAGQILVRGASWLALAVAALFMDRTPFTDRAAMRTARPVGLFLLLTIGLVLMQLVPLPPALWQSLPGRGLLTQAALLTQQPQPWRPLSIVPGMTWNAASSLVVPVAVFVLMAGLSERERRWLPGVLLVVITASMLLGLLQFSGAGFENPLINDTPGQVSGMFANRNHMALFLALGCLIAPVWAFPAGGRAGLRPLVALGLTALFLLTILATGSRTGMALGVLALVVGPLAVHREIRRMLHGRARWILPAIIVALLVAVGGLILLSLMAGRAASIDRVFSVDAGQDMRRLGLPIVWDMVREYFPWGAGIGGFDNLFRMHEPFHLLKLSYFNHAHDDFLEIALDAGLPGLVLLLAAIVWGVIAAIRAWRSSSAGGSEAKLASLMLLLICIASVVDYPARTPMMMTLIVISGLWLSHAGPRRGEPALPHSS